LKGLALAALASMFGLPAIADEDAIRLQPGEGAELVRENCVACHSLDYIQMNSPFLDRKGWTAEVTKMVKAFGAPLEQDDQQKMVEYLTAAYGKK
jgi:mono/diheme cytochrome c family protein